MPSAKSISVEEQLLRAGIAPRHARRLALEWKSHLVSLTEENIAQGQPPEEAGDKAQRQLGTAESLVAKALEQPSLSSFGARWPFVTCGVAPLLGLVASCVLLLLLIAGIAKIDHYFNEPSPVLRHCVDALFWLGLYVAPLTWALIAARYAESRRLNLWLPIIGIVISTALGAITNMQIVWPSDGHPAQLGAGIGFSTNLESLRAFGIRWLPTMAITFAAYVWMNYRSGGKVDAVRADERVAK